MNSKETGVRKLITEAAADWYVANRAGLTAKERDAFAAWLKASPTNVEEYLAVSVVALDLHHVCKDEGSTPDDITARARIDERGSVEVLRTNTAQSFMRAGVRPWKSVAAAMAAAAAVVVVALLHPFGEETPLHYQTGHGEQHTYRLTDKSVLHLNTDTVVTVQYNGRERRIVLNAGEAEFEVAHETTRAFLVLAGPAEVVSIGTKFDVRLAARSTVITVIEGRIAVRRSIPGARGNLDPASPQFVYVIADQQLTVAAGEETGKPVNVDARRTTAWLRRQITCDHEPLEQVANEFNRYSEKPFRITTPALKKLEISGVFTTDDTAAFIAFLRSLDGVHVEESATQISVFKK